jgi:hypothetical protein
VGWGSVVVVSVVIAIVIVIVVAVFVVIYLVCYEFTFSHMLSLSHTHTPGRTPSVPDNPVAAYAGTVVGSIGRLALIDGLRGHVFGILERVALCTGSLTAYLSLVRALCWWAKMEDTPLRHDIDMQAQQVRGGVDVGMNR